MENALIQGSLRVPSQFDASIEWNGRRGAISEGDDVRSCSLRRLSRLETNTLQPDYLDSRPAIQKYGIARICGTSAPVPGITWRLEIEKRGVEREKILPG